MGKYSFDLLNNFIGYGSLEAEYVFFGLEEKYEEQSDKFELKLFTEILDVSEKKFSQSKHPYYSLEDDDFNELYADESIKRLFECRSNGNKYYQMILGYYKAFIASKALDLADYIKGLKPCNLGSKDIPELLIGNVFPVPQKSHDTYRIPELYMTLFKEDIKRLNNDPQLLSERIQLILGFLNTRLKNSIKRKVIIFGEKDRLYQDFRKHASWTDLNSEHIKYFDVKKNASDWRNSFFFANTECYNVAFCNHPISGLSYENVEKVFALLTSY